MYAKVLTRLLKFHGIKSNKMLSWIASAKFSVSTVQDSISGYLLCHNVLSYASMLWCALMYYSKFGPIRLFIFFRGHYQFVKIQKTDKNPVSMVCQEGAGLCHWDATARQVQSEYLPWHVPSQLGHNMMSFQSKRQLLNAIECNRNEDRE